MPLISIFQKHSPQMPQKAKQETVRASPLYLAKILTANAAKEKEASAMPLISQQKSPRRGISISLAIVSI